MKPYLAILLSICLLCPSLRAQEIESKKIYRFVNCNKPDQSMAISNTGVGAVTAKTNTNDIKQEWYVEANSDNTGYYIRNVFNGAYLTSPRTYYTQWPLSFTQAPDNENMLMTITPYEDALVIKAASQGGGYSYAHSDAANNVVCWTAESVSSRWIAEQIMLTEEELQAIFNRFNTLNDEVANAAEYEKCLDELFEDKAYTKLKSHEEITSLPAYISLPQKLREMVDKIILDDWSEKDGDWNDNYSRKYRVQLYEPFSEGSAAAGLAGIQPYTNMNNPTGIIADEGELLYVMVENDVSDGATLYIGGVPDNNMYNSVNSGVRLHKGLNIIPCASDITHYFIYYTVNTVENKKPIRSLSEYSPIKIHIEGGRINGFFNYVGDDLYSPDTKNDFNYVVSRAKHQMFDLLGKYVILHFFLEDTPDTLDGTVAQLGVKSCFDPEINQGSNKQYDPVVTMKAWDSMCFAERIVMGIQSDEDIADPFNRGYYSSIVGDGYNMMGYNADPGFHYSDYFNNRMMGITMQAQGLYMNATSWRTAYAPGTMVAILTMFPHEGIWGPAHEYGHINQTPMRIAGTTEESNNLFSNVANYYLCGTTSRCNYPSDQLKIFNEDKTYLEHGTWGTTRMFWQLWCYYHAAGNNTKFYPRLYELLRKYPLKRDMETYPGKLNPRYDLLHFAKMCCVAAGEDLTDFFTSWGFFVPQNNYHIDDYDVYDCILTQEDIEAVKKEIAELGLPKNYAILLIDDRVNSELPAGFGYDKSLCGDFGGLNAFAKKQGTQGNLDYSLEGDQMTILGNGNPGAGFLIYDNAGNLLGFSNSRSFPVSAKTKTALEENKAIVYAVGCDNKMNPIGNVAGLFDINENSGTKFDVIDLNGRVLKRSVNEDEIRNMPAGVYILRNGTKSRKVIVK